MKGTILIFDDDKDLLEVCKLILESKGFKVIVREDCINILQFLENQPCDTILMDNWIQDLGGVRATQLIKKSDRFRSIPIIFFSGNSEIKQLAEEAGAEYYLQKPFNLDELSEMVNLAISTDSEQW